MQFKGHEQSHLLYFLLPIRPLFLQQCDQLNVCIRPHQKSQYFKNLIPKVWWYFEALKLLVPWSGTSRLQNDEKKEKNNNLLFRWTEAGAVLRLGQSVRARQSRGPCRPPSSHLFSALLHIPFLRPEASRVQRGSGSPAWLGVAAKKACMCEKPREIAGTSAD